MSLQFKTLFQCPEYSRTVVHWWNTVWADRIGPDLEKFERRLLASMSENELPILLIAFENLKPCGTAALKLQELEDYYPNCQYWLGSVFVAEQYRGKGVAAQLSLEVVKLAQQRGLPQLYLQTSAADGGLYSKLGWQPVEHFLDRGQDTLLMRKVINPS